MNRLLQLIRVRCLRLRVLQGKFRSGLAYSLGRALNTRSLRTLKLKLHYLLVEANHPQLWHHARTAKPTRCHVVVSIVQYRGVAPLD